MDEKEIRRVEEMLKREADKEKNTKIDDFDARYAKIKSELRAENGSENAPRIAYGGVSSNGSVMSKSKPLVIAVALLLCVAVALSVILPVAFRTIDNGNIGGNGDDITYYAEDELGAEIVTRDEFYAGLGSADIHPVDLDAVTAVEYVEYRLLMTKEDRLVKGGMVDARDGEDEATMSLSLRFCDSTVKISPISYEDYDLTYTTGSAVIIYKLSEYMEAGGIEAWQYKACTWYNDLFYAITYFTLEDNLTELFDTLFG